MDKEYLNMSISITKALNSGETPLKMKHARNIIIATYRLKEAKTLWKLLTRQRLMEHRFTAWKFCHLLHKLMREGEPSVLKQSLTHKTLILEVGKLWGHLQDGFGPCIESYTKLLVYKLQFHEKNSIFPGSLALDFVDIEQFAAHDINVHFQMCVEIFDYLDHIIELQSKIITSFNSFRMTSMTPQGQCRLAPLITLIQDSNPLYDTCVRIMFKLHNNLTDDILSGHRARFNDIFSALKYIYDKVRPLQYFADVVQFPTLPENVPNFRSQVELNSYKTPIMFVMQEPELHTAQLMEDDVIPPQASRNEKADGDHHCCHTFEVIKRLQEQLLDKENQLKNEVSLLDKVIQLTVAKQTLESEIMKIQENLHKASEQNEFLQRQLIEGPKLDDKSKESEESAKSHEEKFKKIKVMYAKLRDEHVNLLRLHGDNKRCLDSEKKTNNELQRNLEDLYIKIRYLESSQQDKINEYEQRLTNKSNQVSRLEDEIKESQANYQQAVDLNTKIEEINEALKTANVTIEMLEKRLQTMTSDLDELKANDIKSKNQLIQHTEGMKAFFENMKLYAMDALNDFDYNIENILKHNVNLQQSFYKLYTDHEAYSNDRNDYRSLNSLVTTYMQLTIILTKFHGQVIFIASNCSDINRAQELLEKYKQFCKTLTCVNGLLLKESSSVTDLPQMLNTIVNELQAIHQILLLLRDTLNEEINIGDMLQEELEVMDKIIEEATTQILEIHSQSILKHNGIQLELNEKIFDSCTALMHAIKVLIQKSRLLQQEIVSQGKDNFPNKEFYKRNSQWTEGLLSASKNIAKGANFLVEAANRFFNSESTNNFEIIAAAQEIAASTTQLVIASKVKADKNSHKLAELTIASRNVSQATGSVVAAVESKSIHLNNLDEFDITNLTTSQLKAREMEIHVKLLELEKALQNERYKLSSFRKACYRNPDEFENC